MVGVTSENRLLDSDSNRGEPSTWLDMIKGQATVTTKTETCTAACAALKEAERRFGKAKEALDAFNANPNSPAAVSSEARIKEILLSGAISAHDIRELARRDAERKSIQVEFDAADRQLDECAENARIAYEALVDDFVRNTP